MKLCLGEGFQFRNVPLADAAKQIKQIGYDYLELLWGTRIGNDTKDKGVRQVNQILERVGLGPLALLGGGALASLDPKVRRQAVKTLRRQIEVAKMLGCGVVTCEMSGGNMVDQARCIKAFKRSVEETLPILEENDISLSFEPHPGDFIEDSATGVQVLREIGSKNVGYLYCCPHTFVLAGENPDSSRRTPEQMIKEAGKLLNFVHLADSHKMERIVVSFAPEGYASMRDVPKYKGMKVHEHLVPGHGEVDFGSVFTGLRAINYDGSLSCIPFATDDPQLAARESLQMVQKHLRV